MKSTEKLPQGYRPIYFFDLMNNKKDMLVVNGVAIVLIILMFFYGISQSPICFDWKIFFAFAGVIVYLFIHEAIHGAFMKFFGSAKVQYGFNGLYAFAGSSSYFYKIPYLVIVLAPVVLLGLLLCACTHLFVESWFWVFYFIQIVNISGSAGDLYVFFKIAGLSKDILVKDTGVTMTVYENK